LFSSILKTDIKLDASYLLNLVESDILTTELLDQVKDHIKTELEYLTKKLLDFMKQNRYSYNLLMQNISTMKEQHQIQKESCTIQEKANEFIKSYSKEFTLTEINNKMSIEFPNKLIKVFSSKKDINSFIVKFTMLKELEECIIYGKNKDIINIYNRYMFELRKAINEESVYKKVEDYVLSEIYTKAFPKLQTKADKYFHTKTLLLNWIHPTKLGIKKENLGIDYWTSASEYMKRMEEMKTPKGKVEQVIECYNLLKKGIMKFSRRSESPGADDLVPFLTYILILSAPERMYSNIK
jgi:hypothetical protein